MLGLTAGLTPPLPPAQHNWSTHGLPIWMWCLELSDFIPLARERGSCRRPYSVKSSYTPRLPELSRWWDIPCPAMPPSHHWWLRGAFLLWLSHTCSGKTQSSASYCLIKELKDSFAHAATKKTEQSFLK